MGHGPHFFNIIKFTDFGPEEVDDDVTGINDNPVALRHSFGTNAGLAPRMNTFGEFFRHADDLSGRCSRSDDDVVGKGGLAAKVDHFDVKGLVIIK